MKSRLSLLLLVLSLLSFGIVSAQEAPLRVLATTSIVADVAQNVAGDLLTVEALLPIGADTHAFEPVPADAVRVAEADILLTVGAGYEGFLGDLLENAGDDAAQVVVVSNGIEILGFSEDEHDHEDEEHHSEEATADPMATPEAEAEHEDEHEHEGAEHIGVLGSEDLECEAHEDEDHSKRFTNDIAHDEHEHEHGACDPHVWTDPRNVIVWANNIADAFTTADPTNADTYRANADAYIASLEVLHAEIEALVETLPEERRVLVTNHEFMGYFAYAYSFEVVGTVLPGVTTDLEPNPQELAELIELIGEEGVRAIFAEVSANPQLAEVVAEEAGIAVVTTLYSESLSETDGPASTYLDYMRYNAQTIVTALSN
ncbi:MAG: metal ABC transporter substrate-binding protein [Chloroflexota bacterium]|nr:metal ABC transporter substrate-binding protein [Chloroflexota bacterium]